MTTDVNAEIAELKEEEEEVKAELKQVKAALEGYASRYFSHDRSEAFQRAGLYGGFMWSVGGLQNRLSVLENHLTELRKKENLLLEARRVERAPYLVAGTTRYFSDERGPQRRLASGSLVDVPEDEGLFHLMAQRPRGAWRLELVVPKGIQLLQLRKKVYSWAEESCAYYTHNDCYWDSDEPDANDGRRSIAYDSDNGDLAVDLFFKTEGDAENFRTRVVSGLNKWHGANLPHARNAAWDPEQQLDANLRVWAADYEKAPPTPPRDAEVPTIDRSESANSDGTTTVITDPKVIALESWVDPERTHLPFHECHIDESIKRTKAKDQAIKDKRMDPYPEEDTAGNKIPLPIDWHFLYDKKGATRPSYLSFKASELPCDSPLLEPRRHNGETYTPLQVDIFFHSDLGNDEITSLLRPVKNPQHISGRTYQVHIFKREPEMFIRKTAERHKEIIDTWP